MPKHRSRVGLNGRNHERFTEGDFRLVRQARIETLKMMSQTEPGVYRRLRRENPKIRFIVRLFDDRVRSGSFVQPAEFVARMVPIINSLKPYTKKFEIHNEPNHVDGLEGWGASDAHAKSFHGWYLQVLRMLKQACPWAKFGFPGLALNHPHRDLEWLDICHDAVRASDWLGCHCYWQYGNMLSEQWGRRFKLYHKRFPNMPIEITEFGNSTPNLSRDAAATQYVQYYTELNKHFYIRSASAFIASSQDPTWDPFVWMREGGEMQPVVDAVARMEREAVDVILERYFYKTGKMVRGIFLDFFNRYGLEICGYPITGELKEGGLRSQYFQRLGLEESSPGTLRLKRVGKEAWSSRGTIRTLKSRIKKLKEEPLPALERAVEELSTLLSSLATEIDSLKAALEDQVGQGKVVDGGLTSLVEPLREEIDVLEKLYQELKALLERALTLVSGEQSDLVASLEAKIRELQKELDVPRADPQAPSQPEPEPEPVDNPIPKPAIEHIVDSLPKHETEVYETRARTDIQSLVVHHSATPANVLPERIAQYHIRKWDWPGIGYHFLVAADGTLYQTNELETISHHAARVNPVGAGICFLGSFMEHTVPPDQLKAGAHLLAWLLGELQLDPTVVKGHKEFMQTACPGTEWLEDKKWKVALLEQIGTILDQYGYSPPPQPDPPAQDTAAKPIYQYVLFGGQNGGKTDELMRTAQTYVTAFQPSVGSRVSDAVQAEYVTIVGGPQGISKQVENWLAANGCKVERIAGENASDTKRILDGLASRGRRFVAFEA